MDTQTDRQTRLFEEKIQIQNEKQNSYKKMHLLFYCIYCTVRTRTAYKMIMI